MNKPIKLPPLPMPDQGRAFVRGFVADDAKLESWCRAAIEADRQARGEPVAEARNAALEEAASLLEDRADVYAYSDGPARYGRNWAEAIRALKSAPDTQQPTQQAGEPVKPMHDWTEDAHHENGNYQCKCVHCGEIFVGHKRRVVCKVCDKENASKAAKGDIAGWLRRRADYPIVSIPGRLAGEIADHIESLSEKDADHLRDATKMIEPVKVRRERELMQALNNIDPLVRALMNRLGSGEACGGLDVDQSLPDSTTQVLLRAVDKFEERVLVGNQPAKVPSDDEILKLWGETNEDWPLTYKEAELIYAFSRTLLAKFGTEVP